MTSVQTMSALLFWGNLPPVRTLGVHSPASDSTHSWGVSQGSDATTVGVLLDTIMKQSLYDE